MMISFFETPTALLRQMVRYVSVEVELVAEGVCVSSGVGRGSSSGGYKGGGSGDDSLI